MVVLDFSGVRECFSRIPVVMAESIGTAKHLESGPRRNSV